VKVLVADDTPTNQTLVSQMLSRMGAEVEIASDGVEALHWLERERFDVALIDIEMPRLSGLDVIRAIRTNERPNDRQQAVMPVVALTAFVVRAQREAIYAAGADAILAKPLGGPETLGMTLAAVLGRQSGTCGPDDGAADGAAPDVAPDFDRARFDHLLDISGPDGARELLDRLQSDLARSLQGLRDGLAAGDRACIRAETHVLIALGGAVGSNRVRALAERINAAAHAHHALPDPADGAELLREVAAMIAFAAAERARLEVPG
jgi:CheY-like chemotaxis protein